MASVVSRHTLGILPEPRSPNPEPRTGAPDSPGKYIYCITDSDAPESFGPVGVGGPNIAVYTIGHHGVGAVVSDSPVEEHQRNRDNLIAHERAIETVMKTHVVLPARFSTIADNEDMVVRILKREHGRFQSLLNGIRGKVEFGLKAIFDEPSVCQEILQKYTRIRELRDKIAHLPPVRTHYQRIEIGRMVESALKQEKDSYREEIMSALTPLALEVKTNGVWNDKMILNAAFLLEQQRTPDFDRRVEQLSNQYGARVMFKMIGTVPPFNFVNLVINTREYRSVSA
jgi:hypothetical protein